MCVISTTFNAFPVFILILPSPYKHYPFQTEIGFPCSWMPAAGTGSLHLLIFSFAVLLSLPLFSLGNHSVEALSPRPLLACVGEGGLLFIVKSSSVGISGSFHLSLEVTEQKRGP